MEKLTEDEMRQLKMLLIRYFAYHAEGVFNMAIDAVLAKFRGTPVIDVTPIPEPPNPKSPARRARKSAVAVSN